MGAARNKIVLIGGGLVVFVLLYFAPKIKSTEAVAEENPAAVAVDENARLDVYLRTAIKNLSAEEQKDLDARVGADSLLSFWSLKKRPDLAAHFSEEKARETNKASDWFLAGNRYYYSVQFVGDKTEEPVLIQSAARCFRKGLALEPDNTDASIMLASTYVESGTDPMKGIGMLREIEKKDSNNVKLQLSFAFFSLKSGQTEKAIARFKKVLKIDPGYLEAYLHLADAYEQQGNKEGTIEMLEQYGAKTDDAMARLEVNKYIKQLKETK
jgi:predicted Zn-dependent protease